VCTNTDKHFLFTRKSVSRLNAHGFSVLASYLIVRVM